MESKSAYSIVYPVVEIGLQWKAWHNCRFRHGDVFFTKMFSIFIFVCRESQIEYTLVN